MSAFSEAAIANESKPNPVLTTYTNRMRQHQHELAATKLAHTRALIAVLSCLLLAALCFVLKAPALVIAILPAAAALHFFLRYSRLGQQWKQLGLHCDYFERGIARLNDAWQGSGDTGREFAHEHHIYQDDLNVLGKGSLFELLCTTRSKIGAKRLAAYLLNPVEFEETKHRQQAVKELRSATRQREQIDQLGDYRFQDCSDNVFQNWFALPVLTVPRAIPWLLLVSSSISLLLVVAIFAKLLLLSYWAPMLLSLFLVQAVIGGILFQRIRPRLQLLRPLVGSLAILQQGLELMQRGNFQTPKLHQLIESIRSQQATAHLRKLNRLFGYLDQREKPQFYLVSLLLAVGTQLVIAIERWRAIHQEEFKSWLDTWAEFEALQALAGYAYEQQGTVFPELTNGPALFEANNLGHPLLAADRCIGNDVSLNPHSRCYIISGSNMAGKSTFLRTIGLNTVLALAGAPIRASSGRLSHLTVCASLGIADSLLDGKSKFLAEVERLHEMIVSVESGKPVLFLIDEILSGTNSHDRRTAAEMIVKALLSGNAIGALSTHDLALTEIAQNQALSAVLVHMKSENPDRPLDFDFLIKPGVSQHTNALAIVKMIGIVVSPGMKQSRELANKLGV